ncbi:hypothetical protein D505_01995 [Elizabethkingia anophelis R26]|nr:hypothetical protein D505_01995 [Elizabethkingia anophelis R26]
MTAINRYAALWCPDFPTLTDQQAALVGCKDIVFLSIKQSGQRITKSKDCNCIHYFTKTIKYQS